MTNKLPAALACDLAVQEDRLAAQHGAPHQSSKRASYIRTQSVTLEQRLTRHGVLALEVHQREIGGAADRQPTFAGESESPRWIHRRERGDTLRFEAAQQHRE